MDAPQVKVGQVWEDNDPRFKVQRRLVVDAIENGKAACRSYNGGSPPRKVRIRLDRFRATSTGYRLVEDVT